MLILIAVLSNEDSDSVQMCMQTRQNLHCSYTQSKGVDENTDQCLVRSSYCICMDD